MDQSSVLCLGIVCQTMVNFSANQNTLEAYYRKCVDKVQRKKKRNRKKETISSSYTNKISKN